MIKIWLIAVTVPCLHDQLCHYDWHAYYSQAQCERALTDFRESGRVATGCLAPAAILHPAGPQVTKP